MQTDSKVVVVLKTFMVVLAVSIPIANALGQAGMPEKSEPPMAAYLPKVGTAIQKAQLCEASGVPFPTNQFRDHYTVLVFGCLT